MFTFEIDGQGRSSPLTEEYPERSPVRHVDLRRLHVFDARRALGLPPKEFDLLLVKLGIIIPSDHMLHVEVVGQLEAEVNKRRRIAHGMRG